MNCPNCGRPLAEGEVCNCVNNASGTEPQAAPEQPVYYQPPVNEAYDQSQQATYFQPQQNYYQEPEAPVSVPARTDYPEGYKPKKKYVAVVLAVTFGSLGLHNFYLGYKNKAVTQLLICLIGSLFFGLGLIVAEIWAVVDCIQILTEKQDKDAEGFKIQTFAEELVAEKIKAEKNNS